MRTLLKYGGDLLWITSGKIEFEVFISYIKKYENSSINHALNVFGTNYIVPLYKLWNPVYDSVSFSEYIDFSIPGVTAEIYETSCYECGHTHKDIIKNNNRDYTAINKWIHEQKHGNKSKIPIYRCESHVESFFC